MAETGFKEVRLYKDVLGIGAYGSVCRASCDGVLCAAKILHPTLVVDHPGAKSPQARFRRECEFLSSLRHPNVVQYLGTWQDPVTNLPVLLMELMDKSLTQFLEERQQDTPLPFHTQVDICHDVALALSFLHSNTIIHRDLSSNNVLMIGDRRAKVTDFGMARLLDLDNEATKVNFSMCPGTDVYMPPEAVRENPTYTNRIDSFSFGVLTIQVLSRKFPSPGKRVKPVIMGGMELLEPQTEFSRREEDIKIVDSNNPLLSIACDCLRDREEERPSTRDLCLSIAKLKEDGRYSEAREAEAGSSERDEELERLTAELEELRVAIRERDARLSVLEKDLLSKNELLEARSSEIEDLEERLNISQKQNLELLRESMQQQQAPPTPDHAQTSAPGPGEEVVTWRKATDAPCAVSRSSDAVTCGDFLYLRPGNSQRLLAYNCGTDSWSELLPPPTNYSTLASVRNTLVVIGGFDSRGEKTNQLYTLSTANKSYIWLNTYPPMPTKRDSAMAACYGGYLVVAGGVGTSYLNTVELLHLERSEWLTGASLPSETFSGSASVCGDRLYLLGGLTAVGTITYSVMTCSLRALVDSSLPLSNKNGTPTRGDGVWSYASVLPVAKSTCISFRGRLLAVGGHDKTGMPSGKIWAYEEGSKSWSEFGECERPRSQCCVAVLPGDQLMVAGGFTARYLTGETASTEIAAYKS